MVVVCGGQDATVIVEKMHILRVKQHSMQYFTKDFISKIRDTTRKTSLALHLLRMP